MSEKGEKQQKYAQIAELLQFVKRITNMLHDCKMYETDI